MSTLFEKIDEVRMPLLILRGLVVFPELPVTFEVNRAFSKKALERAAQQDNLVLIVTQIDAALESPGEKDIYRTGVIARVNQTLKLPDNNLRILVEGICRAEILSIELSGGCYTATALKKQVVVTNKGGLRGEALLRRGVEIFERYSRHLPKLSAEINTIIQNITYPGALADFIASNISLKYDKKQRILDEFEPLARLELLCEILEEEDEILTLESQIHRKVKGQLEHNHREFYLREQLKIIQGELGINEEIEEDNEYYEKIEQRRLPEEVREKLLKELKKLKRLSFGSPENSVIRNWLDICLELPWDKKTKDRLDIVSAEKVLNDDHYGLEKVKERILEILAVQQMNPNLKGQIICLVGPPGVGKTSIAASIARAMKRKYVRMSLGGVRDEAEIRGHRKTYIGAMPGRIINALRQAGSANPLVLLDEIDKLTRDVAGDPSSALLEVLDSEQNKSFRDHYIELPVDLSDCLFIATANTADTIPRPLLDRMEIIHLSSYTRNEKYHIGREHLYGKQLKKHGLSRKQLKLTEAGLYEIIDYYTREAGVRTFERELASICRKTAKKLVSHPEITSYTLTPVLVNEMLGVRKYREDASFLANQVGVVNGLAWTSVGGELLQVEVAATAGTGRIELTGSLGDVMKESARAAITYIRTKADKYGIDPDFYKNRDIHVHFPEGAIPKDGPSAGITMACALVSELSGIPVRGDVTMTGEITLRGRVLAIGGLKEKTIAAFRNHIGTVIIPESNLPDLEEIDPLVQKTLTFIPAATIDAVLDNALVEHAPATRIKPVAAAEAGAPPDVTASIDYIPLASDTLPAVQQSS